MLPIEVAVAVIPQVLHHLLGGPLYPARCLGLRALVPAEDAEVAGLGLYDAAGVVVGERVLRVAGTGLGPGGVAVSEGPWVALH